MADLDTAQIAQVNTDLPEADSFLIADLFVQPHTTSNPMNVGYLAIALAGAECIAYYPSQSLHLPLPSEQKDSEELFEKINRQLLTEEGFYCLAACCFANCKNVTLQPVPVSRQMRRFAERHNQPVFEHHVLVIDPSRSAPHACPKSSPDTDAVRALHLCRGHFARYGEAFGTGKLFGKLEGQFWIPQHVRGHAEQGVVTKDYKILNPE
ncbi:MAG TPA: hypothetical protein VH601_16710 [Bryobacteraceae bacterium]|jgi:hypothetical protein